MDLPKIAFRFAFLSLTIVAVGGARGDDVRFSRDILPLLSDRCFHCHGPDEANREAGLRLDLRESVVEDRDGYSIVVPGEPDKSELLSRIVSDDPDLRMPPADSHRKPLSKAQVAKIQDWIKAGAKWGKHWAFESPVRASIPKEIHPIDFFVRERLESEGVKSSPRARRATLARRAAFDLTGLPPTKDQLKQFLADESDDAFNEYVDLLLRSPHYGERMAMWWLDAARYSDTDGFQQDATRTNWPWRDWVIESFNANKPFDQFTIEQFAGDLLPDATKEQILATAFHRNHMTNGEGGRHPEESRIDYVIDRVNTTGSVWLGLTLGCAQCHSHKFDPITQADYYRLFAFFNSIEEDGKAGRGAKPYLKFRSPHVQPSIDNAAKLVARRRAVEAAAKQQAEKEFDVWLNAQFKQVKGGGFTAWRYLKPNAVRSVEGTILSVGKDDVVQTSGPAPKQDDYWVTGRPGVPRVTGLRLEVLPHESHTGGKLSRGSNGEFILTDVKLQLQKKGQSQVREIELNSAIASGEKKAKGRNYGNIRDTLDDDPRNGWTTEGLDSKKPYLAVYALTEPLVLNEDEELTFIMLHRSTRGDANIGRFRIAFTDQAGRAVRSLDSMPLERLAKSQATTAADIDSSLRSALLDQFLTDHAAYQEAKADLDRANRQLSTVKRAAGELGVMVLQERKQPRVTHILERGVWDKKGDAVQAGVPEAILKPVDDPKTRLQFAKWLVAGNNPLTARVIANQLWQLCFGAGLVRTPEDFGLQGELPTHPKLLDWLALELVEGGWDMQHVLKLIMTSETYQQSSRASKEMLERDPENRLLARAARFRLPSWMIRDAALQSSGLLNAQVGGPPVMPYQPPGVWADMFMGRFRYEPSQGPAQHRRTIYAFWRRAAAPTFLFDSAQRRVCEVRPRRTNTPLHALTLLNDLSLLESARALAANTSDTPPAKHLDVMFQAVLSRGPTKSERAVLSREYDRALRYYQKSPQDIRELLNFGQPELREAAPPSPELAARLLVASMLFNLDEAITHE